VIKDVEVRWNAKLFLSAQRCVGNEPGQVLDLFVGELFGDSDHNSVTFSIAMERDRNIRQGKVYNWGKGNYDAMRQELGSIRWEQKLSGKGTTEMWNLFKEQILRVLDMYVPVRQGGNWRVTEPWFMKEIQCLVKRKKEAYVRMRKQSSVRVLEGYKLARKELKEGIRRAKRGHEKSLAGRINENSKAFYAYVRNKRMTRVRLGPVKYSSGNLCMESEAIGEALNEYFSSVFTNERGHDVEEDSVIQAGRLEEVDIQKEDVLAILKSLRIDKSPGPDGIFPRILWRGQEIAEL